MRVIEQCIISVLILLIPQTIGNANTNEVDECNLPINLINEIKAHAPMVQNILNEAVNGSFKGRTWKELADFVDTFGPRLSGTQVLEDSIDYVLNKSVSYGLENVHGEIVKVPHWVRGSESATLLQPWKKHMAILGLGYSVGTPAEGITARAIVVDSFDELKQRAKEVQANDSKKYRFNARYCSTSQVPLQTTYKDRPMMQYHFLSHEKGATWSPDISGFLYLVCGARPAPVLMAINVDSVNAVYGKSDKSNTAFNVPGKIVVYNEKYISYGETVKYRGQGATEASKLGAVAALVRSVTPKSLYTPHTGVTDYAENVTKIPVACITIEDATLLRRMSDKGKEIVINLKMEAQNLPDKESRNVVAEVIGTEKQQAVVVVSGHIDSWDVGQGAMDDGGGAFISWNAVQLLKQLNYRPRRTVRMIMWTAEEMGLIGAREYTKAHKAEEKNLQFVMESDLGTFTPLGIQYAGVPFVGCVLREVLRLTKPLGEMNIVRTSDPGPDISYWTAAGVPSGSLWNKNDKYFYYHHTNADTILVEDPHALDMGTALFAAVSYVIADLSVDLPRHE